MQPRTEKAAETLRDVSQQTSGRVLRCGSTRPHRREHFFQSLSLSHRQRRYDCVQSLPGSHKYLMTGSSPARAREGTAGPPASERGNRKSKTTTLHEDSINFNSRDDTVTQRDRDDIRSIIRGLLSLGIIKIGRFSETIGCTASTVTSFLSNNDTNGGHDSDVFKTPLRWLDQQLVDPKTPALPSNFVISRLEDIHLDGEETGSVPVWDSCDEIRSKMAAFLDQADSPNRNQFCRALGAQLKTTEYRRLISTQVDRFRAKKGPYNGSKHLIYYAAYVFFEKLRIAEGKPKSKHRLVNEKLYPHGVNALRSMLPTVKALQFAPRKVRSSHHIPTDKKAIPGLQQGQKVHDGHVQLTSVWTMRASVRDKAPRTEDSKRGQHHLD